MHLVDTHQHLWDLNRFPYSWCRGIPALSRTFTLADYREAAAGQGITKTVFVECDVDDPHGLDEARTIDALAAREPLIGGLVATCRPENDGFDPYLDRLAELPSLRGVRRVLHTEPDALSQSSRFVDNVRRLATRGLTFDLCVLARQLPAGVELVKRCPDVTFILDHGGVPDVRCRVLTPWREDIRRMAELPNVVCKVSGLVAYADPQNWTVADLRPFVDHLIECFGWNRLLWGGDWPVCTLSAPLSGWVAATHTLVAHASANERAALFHRTAERIYRL